jgi:hypothetical protein
MVGGSSGIRIDPVPRPVLGTTGIAPVCLPQWPQKTSSSARC